MLRCSQQANKPTKQSSLKLRRYQPGYQIVQLFGLIALTLMISALAIDFSYYYTAYNAIHTAADSAALAAATELYRDRQAEPKARIRDAELQAQQYLRQNQPNIQLQSQDIVFGYIDPGKKIYNPITFATPTASPDFAYANGYNGVWVKVSKTENSTNGPLNTIMANIIGVHGMNMEATSIAMVDQSVNGITNGGVRPFYACEAQVNQAMQDGVLENNLVRIYGDHVELDGSDSLTGCPTKGSGNWSMADFTGCSSSNIGASALSDWLENGYRGPIMAGRCYGTASGDFLSLLGGEINRLIAQGTVFPIPIYNSWSGAGSKANVTVEGFVGFKVTNLMMNGPASERYIEGHFYRYLCNTGCQSMNSGQVSPAGSVVKIRLASRS